MLIKSKTLPFLSVIIALAFILRAVLITYNPPSLNWDEVSHGYNAYSILKTGKDEWGKPYPVANFRAYGDYPLPLNLYLTIPSILILGLSEFSIRIPHTILGVLTVVAAYFLALGVTKKKSVGLVASLLVAIEPWTLFTSRFVVQSNLSVFLLTASMAAFFNRDRNKLMLALSFLLLGLSLFSYHSTRIFSPLLLIALFIIYKRKIISTPVVLLTILFFVPLPFILSSPEARARSSIVFLINEGAINRIVEARASSDLPPTLTRLVYNRPVYFVKEFAKNYLDYFSPQFLFFSGGTQHQFSVPQKGLSYPVNLLFFLIGLVIITRKSLGGDKNYQIVLIWLLLSPIPASLTTERFAVLRATTMLPLPQMLSALGLVATAYLFKKFKPGLYLIYLVLLGFFLEGYLTEYFTVYRSQYSSAWQYGYKEAVDYVKSHYDKYDKIIVTKKYGEPHEFFLFFLGWDPQKYRNDPSLIRFYQSGWFWVDRFDKFYFINDWDIPKDEGIFVLESKEETVDCSLLTVNCLLITSPGNYPKEWIKLETINFLDGKGAFEIVDSEGGTLL